MSGLIINVIFEQSLKAVLEKDKEKAVKESVQLKASVTTLTAKVETLNKNIELQKQTEKELQVSAWLSEWLIDWMTATDNVWNAFDSYEQHKS